MYQENQLVAQSSVGAAVNRYPQDIASKETVFSVNAETINTLYECASQLDGLIYKLEGPTAAKNGQSAATPVPIQSIQDDARRIRGMASQLLGRIQYLHDALGKN